ncbi:MAG: alpha/beta hydrolase, partial [Gemmatimonadaceae bacterium]|jgi:pimeloyl-ACP methyl ester carboxylesterase
MTAWAVDLLGHGESDRPADADFGVAAQALCVEQAMTSLRIGRATVVGVDLGAAVAVHLAATRPARVHGIVLISPPPLGRVRGEDLAEFGRLTGTHLLEATRGMLGAATVLGPLLARGVGSPEAMPDRLVTRYAAPFVGPDGVRHLQALANAVTDDDAEELDMGRITARALVLRGERDAWCSPVDAARLATAIPGAELRTIPLSGRLVPEEAPEALASLLADWAPPVRTAGPAHKLSENDA